MKIFLLLTTFCTLVLAEKIKTADVFTYSKSQCYGTCPAYEVTLSSDGELVFKGEKFVESVGVYKIKKSPKLFSKIEQILSKYKFDSYKDSYYDNKSCKEMWTDHPTTTIGLKLNGKTKKVEHYLGCKGFKGEKSLYEMEDEIDNALDLGKYIGK